MSDQRHRVQADHSERDAPLLELLRQAGDFDVRMTRFTVGDHLIKDDVLIERKTIADFAASLVEVVCFLRRLASRETDIAL